MRILAGVGLVVVAAVVALVALSSGSGESRPSPVPAWSSATRSSDPLAGLSLYVDPNSPAARQAARWRAAGRVADADALKRIADQPTAHWLVGGDRTQADTAKIVAAASAAHAVAVLVLYDIPGRDCHSFSSGGATGGKAYLTWVSEVAAGIGTRRAIVLLEPDAIDQAAEGCLTVPEALARYQLLASAVEILRSATRAFVYLDAGHAAWLAPQRVVEPLRRAGVRQADGFVLNVSNFQTTQATIAYGGRISRSLGGSHFVIDTSRNGNGPPAGGDGVGRWCNPPGRALGQSPTVATGRSLVDAYLWVKYPGSSDGACGPGQPPAGAWWPDYALALALARRGA